MADPVQHVVVTGAGGFVGRHVALALMRRGHAVRGTARTPVRGKQAKMAIEACEGATAGRFDVALADLEADDGWARALAGADVLMHTASPFPGKAPKDEQEIIRPAVEGTRRVLTAAAKAGIRRVVLTSSIAAVMYGDGRAPYDERDWTDVAGPLATAYYKSKTLAERAAWDLAADLGLDMTVINPGMVLGPMIGRTPGTSIAIIRNLLNGKYPAVPDFRVPIVDVRDVADAHLLALETPAAIGERFIAAGAALSFSDIVAILREVAPSHAGKLPGFTAPNWAARAAAPMHSGLAMIVRELGRDNSVTSEKAQRVLGWAPRSERDAIRATAQSLIEAELV